MRAEPKTSSAQKAKTFIQKMESMNPHHLFLYMSVMGSAFIFVFVLITFNISGASGIDIQFPPAFYVATLSLIIANLSIRRVIRHFLEENMHKIVVFIGITMMMNITFLLSQFVAWEQLYYQGVRISGDAFGSYIYLISALHVLHLLAAFVFLARQFFTYLRASSDAVKALMVTTNPYHLVKLKMLVTCWNFLDIVWIAIAINFFIVL